MLHTKFRGNRSTGSGRFLRGFYHIWAWLPSWSCDPDAANKISFPLPKEAPQNLALIDHAVWEMFENVDG